MPAFLTQPLWPEFALAALLLAAMALAGSIAVRHDSVFGTLADGIAVSYLAATAALAVLGIAGRISAGSLAAFAALVAVGAALGAVRLVRSASFRARPEPTIGERVYLVATVPLVSIGLAAAVVPEVWPDALSYHLHLPEVFVRTGRIAWDPDLFPTGYPLSPEALGTFFAAVGRTQAAKPLHFLVGLIAAAATMRLGGLLFDRTTGALAALLFFASPLVFWVGSTANSDLWMALFFVLSMTRLVRYRRGGRRADLALAALIAGLLPTVKLTGAAPVLLLAAAAWAAQAARTGRRARALIPTLAFLAAAAVPSIPWLVRAAVQTGDPFFPLFLSAFGFNAEVATHLAFVTVRNLETSGAIHSLADVARMPLDLLLAPERFGHLTIGFAVPLLFGVGVCADRQNRTTRRLAALCAVGALLWFAGVRQVRYLTYLVPLLALVAARAASRTRAGSLGGHLAWLAVVGALWLPTMNGVWHRVQPDHWRLTPAFSVDLLAGRIDRETYLTERSPVAASAAAHRWVDANLPDGALVLGVDNTDHFLARRPMIDTSHSTDAWWAQRELLEGKIDAAMARLKRRGVTHLLVRVDREGVADPIRDRLTRFYANERFTLYRLEDAR